MKFEYITKLPYSNPSFKKMYRMADCFLWDLPFIGVQLDTGEHDLMEGPGAIVAELLHEGSLVQPKVSTPREVIGVGAHATYDLTHHDAKREDIYPLVVVFACGLSEDLIGNLNYNHLLQKNALIACSLYCSNIMSIVLLTVHG